MCKGVEGLDQERLLAVVNAVSLDVVAAVPWLSINRPRP
jgi:hypothetical protein